MDLIDDNTVTAPSPDKGNVSAKSYVNYKTDFVETSNKPKKYGIGFLTTSKKKDTVIAMQSMKYTGDFVDGEAQYGEKGHVTQIGRNGQTNRSGAGFPPPYDQLMQTRDRNDAMYNKYNISNNYYDSRAYGGEYKNGSLDADESDKYSTPAIYSNASKLIDVKPASPLNRKRREPLDISLQIIESDQEA